MLTAPAKPSINTMLVNSELTLNAEYSPTKKGKRKDVVSFVAFPNQ